jgi:hypothetical protein
VFKLLVREIEWGVGWGFTLAVRDGNNEAIVILVNKLYVEITTVDLPSPIQKAQSTINAGKGIHLN